MQLYKNIFPKIKLYICNNSGTDHDALDVFQDAVIILCKQVKLGRFNRQHDIAGFLYAISRNLWINKVKKAKRLVYVSEHSEFAAEDDFSDSIMTVQKEKTLKEIISKLGRKCFELLRYSLFDKIPNKEICEKMGFATENSVKTQKYKCKQKLIGLIEVNPAYKEAFD